MSQHFGDLLFSSKQSLTLAELRPPKGVSLGPLVRRLAEAIERCRGGCFVPLGWEDRLPALLERR